MAEARTSRGQSCDPDDGAHRLLPNDRLEFLGNRDRMLLRNLSCHVIIASQRLATAKQHIAYAAPAQGALLLVARSGGSY